ncbi:FAD/FMN-containing dehydrogenase [Variovorax boronicumulans]|uniref:FAD/FMN-containing dehydrogenase n=1 Tax=Variovorax boronicumulans TaxID=436515 RepID=A0AAW8D3S6_9BURK|nr:FAD-binding oxidoreductase [Variovorax boronicumulans]MDP9894874.1 FAD/FMN-containing dehydrogenase [Variovorax boronicumulans]MDQ0038582.1 FAD/FMN-containing dehydrogenase [Variovorax boronicumulans]MDQ0054806.1 FAD/FMN-containing dehydrogenase [Variovorax boronicumulans]
MADTDTNVIDGLRAIVGDKACLDAAADMQPFTTDYRRLYHGKALAVVAPASTQQVSEVLALCTKHGVPVVPQGGNTSLMGGAVPDASGNAVVLNLRRMNQVLEIDAVNDTMTLQAGVTLQAARAAAETAGRLFPLRIGSEGSCQIGGNLSTNAGGTAVLRYGNMRDLTLSIEAVLPDGRVYSSLRGLRKDNTGYDLKQLFIGSEGTLGIITAAVLKLMPLPSATAVAWVAVKDPHAAVQLLTQAKRTAGQAVTAFELISGPALSLVLASMPQQSAPLPGVHDWMVLIELSSGGDAEGLDATLMAVLEQGMESGLIVDAAVAASMADARAFWLLREEISDAQTREGGSIKCDISIPLSKIAGFIAEASAQVLALAPDARMVIYGHMGDGNVHFNPLRPKGTPAAEFLAAHYTQVSQAVDGLAHRQNGSISAEHGIGVAKRDDLVHCKTPVELALMWQIKRTLDPGNLLNPSKVLPLPAGTDHRATASSASTIGTAQTPARG